MRKELYPLMTFKIRAYVNVDEKQEEAFADAFIIQFETSTFSFLLGEPRFLKVFHFFIFSNIFVYIYIYVYIFERIIRKTRSQFWQ